MAGIDSYTKLMLHMDGADGSTTFTDSSLSPKTITRYGNAQIDTAQSVFGGAAGLFDGNGDYLTVPDSDDWNFGTGDFTVECWYMPLSLTGDAQWRGLICQRYSYNSNHSWSLSVDQNNNGFLFEWTTNGTNIASVSFGGALSIGVWYHVSVSRVGATLYCGVAGTVTERTGTSSALYNSSNVIAIGRLNISTTQTTYDIHGRIEEVRISKGIARWTSNFTPPTSAYDGYAANLSLGDFNKTYSLELTKELFDSIRTLDLSSQGITAFESDVNTLILLHFDGTPGSQVFTDSSSYNRTIYLNGNTQIVEGGLSNQAVQTDTSQFLPLYYEVGTSLNFADQNFTVEFCMEFNTIADCSFLIAKDMSTDNWITFQIYYYHDDSTLSFYTKWNDLEFNYYSLSIDLLYSFEINTPYHIALVRNGNIFTFYVNGVSIGSVESTYVFSNFVDENVSAVFGSDGSSLYNMFDGKMDEFRISNIARYTSDFTNLIHEEGFYSDFSIGLTKDLLEAIKTISVSNVDEYTKLLVHGDGEEGSQLFYDSSELHEISVFGTLPQVSSTSKFGTGSIQFSLPVYTTGNYLTVPNSQDWNFYSDNWTIDFQIYFEPNPLITYHGILHHFDPVDEWGMELRLDQQFSTNNYRILFYLSDENWDDVIYFRTNYIELLPQTWYHIALVVENNIPMIFVNGQSQLLAYSDYLLLPVPTILNDLFIGVSNLISSNKKIDELRISKGIARWTSNFTPPTESYGTNGDINLTMSIDLVQDLQGILTRSLGDFDIYSSFDLLKTLEKILVLGDFDLNQTWYLRKVQAIFSSLILKNNFLLGTSLILKYDIPPLIEINNSLRLINSLIGSVEGNLQILNRLTEPVTGNLTLRNKLTIKDEVEGTLVLKNHIDLQTTPPTYTDTEQDQANFESGLTDPSSPNYNPQLASLTYFYFTEEHTG